MGNNSLRILFVTNNYTPFSGGVVTSINATADQLRAMGHKVFIVTLNFLGKQHVDPYYVLRVPCPIRFMYKKNHMAIPWRSDSYLLRQINIIKPDVIHVHHPFLLGSSAVKIARSLNIPVFFTYHTMYEKYLHYIPLPQILTRAFVMRHVRKFCQKVDGIVVPSTQIKHYLRDHDIKVPIEVIPSPVRSFFLMHDGIQKRKSKPFHLLTVSRFRKEKNLPFLLDVVARLSSKDFIFTLVGFGSEYNALRKYAYQKLKLSPDNVQFVYAPEMDDLQRLYQDAHLFLFSSKTDTQ
ncbi:MAG: glycosyltransferase, partial [bacterium]|nr:glycosyltransferase [bacterium]